MTIIKGQNARGGGAGNKAIGQLAFTFMYMYTCNDYNREGERERAVNRPPL